MEAAYLSMMALTAGYLFRLNRPNDVGSWLAFAGFVVAWPVLYAFVVYGMLKCGLGR